MFLFPDWAVPSVLDSFLPGREGRSEGAPSQTDAPLTPAPELLPSHCGTPGLTWPPLLGTYEDP